MQQGYRINVGSNRPLSAQISKVSISQSFKEKPKRRYSNAVQSEKGANRSSNSDLASSKVPFFLTNAF